MPQIISDTSQDNRIERQRQKARDNLDEINRRAKAALAEADVETTVFVLVPGSRDSIVVFGTQADVTDAQWQRISDVMQRVVSDIMDFDGTESRTIACAEIIPEPMTRDTSDATV